MRGRRLLEFRMPRTGELLTFKTRQIFVFKDGRPFDNTRKRFIKQRDMNGYMAVNIRDDEDKWHTGIMVHDLVASVFIRLLEQGEHTHHVDENRKNNNLSNLQILDGGEHQRQHNFEKWKNGTFDGVAAKTSEKIKQAWAAGAYEGLGEKMRKAWKNGTFDGKFEKFKNVGTSYKPAKKVAQLTKDGKLIRVWPSIMETWRNGYLFGEVSACCRGKRKTHKGFKWMFYQDFLSSQPTKEQQFEARQLFFDFSAE